MALLLQCKCRPDKSELHDNVDLMLNTPAVASKELIFGLINVIKTTTSIISAASMGHVYFYDII